MTATRSVSRRASCPRSASAVCWRSRRRLATTASDEDWGTEYLDLVLAVKVVADIEAAGGTARAVAGVFISYRREDTKHAAAPRDAPSVTFEGRAPEGVGSGRFAGSLTGPLSPPGSTTAYGGAGLDPPRRGKVEPQCANAGKAAVPLADDGCDRTGVLERRDTHVDLRPRLRRLRRDNELSQTDMAQSLGISPLPKFLYTVDQDGKPFPKETLGLRFNHPAGRDERSESGGDIADLVLSRNRGPREARETDGAELLQHGSRQPSELRHYGGPERRF